MQVEHSKSFPKWGLANAFAATVEADKFRGQELRPELAKMTLATYAETYAHRRADWRPGTARTHASHMAQVTPRLGSRRLLSITHGDIEQLRADLLRSGLSATYVQAIILRLSSIMKAAMRDRLIPRNPCEGIRVTDKRPRSEVAIALTTDQAHAVLKALKDPWKRYAELILTTGLRPSEAAGLTWDRIGPELITIDRQLLGVEAGQPVFGPCKTESSSRQIPVPPIVAEWERGDGLLLLGRQGGPLVRSTRQSAWKAMRALVALPDAARGWHTLRHTYVSHALAAGMPLTNIARQVGHRTVAETMTTYSHMIEGTSAQYADVTGHLIG
jgi:integrase